MNERSAVTTFTRLLANTLGSIGNRSLQLDPRSKARLTALEGIVVRFDLVTPGESIAAPLILEIRNGTIAFNSISDLIPNAIVRGTPAALFGWLVTSSDGRAPAGVTFEGDERVLKDIAELARGYRPDLEAPLTRLIGETASRDLLGAAETAATMLRSALNSLGGAAQQQTRAAARSSFVTSPDLSEMLDGLDDLKLRLDRLGARVRSVEQCAGATPVSGQSAEGTTPG